MNSKIVCFLTISLAACIYAQVSKNDIVASSVNDGLLDCYNETEIPGITQLQSHLPSTINTVIDLIRQVENHPNTQMDAQNLVVSLLRRFEQDGINPTTDSSTSSTKNRLGIPYASKGIELAQNKALFKKLLGDARSFNNDSLTKIERCNLHYLISSSIYSLTRGDEDSIKECVGSTIQQRAGKAPSLNPVENSPHVDNSTAEFNSNLELANAPKSSSSFSRSTCPIELGVVDTKWGIVKIGRVLQGISSGFEKQIIDTGADARFAATLAGELTEAALSQGSDEIIIGSQSVFNSTVSPKTAFIKNPDYLNMQVTDAELRGALDGLYLALAMDAIKANHTDIKLSQLLDMYYSDTGINNTLRACNRNTAQTSYFSAEVLQSQIKSYLGTLSEEANLHYTIPSNQYDALAAATVTAFNKYVPSSLPTTACKSSTAVTQRISANLTIYLDKSIEYERVQRLIGGVLDQIDVNPYETSYTLLDGASKVIVNQTNYLSDFFTMFNSSDQLSSGFSYTDILENIINMNKGNLENVSYVGGRSNVALLISKSVPTATDRDFFNERRSAYLKKFSNLKIIVLTTDSTASDFQDLVEDTNDVITFSETSEDTNMKTIADKVATKLRAVPRALVNSACGSAVDDTSDRSTVVWEDFVEVNGYINYTLAPQYFYNSDDTQLIITENQYGKINVCLSNGDVPANCTILSSNETSVDLSQFCSGTSFDDCTPIQISVEGLDTSNKCSDAKCRFPNSIKYTFQIQALSCTSDAARLLGNFAFVAVLFFLTF